MASWRALTAQVKPHFLFNSLNMVEYLVETDPKNAKFAVRQLAQLYRRVLAHSKQELIRIGDEVGLVSEYLSIQKLRFGDRLQHSVAVPKSLESVLIPPHILFHLVENAVKHGVDKRSEPTPVGVNVQTDGDSVLIAVSNPLGRLGPKEKGESFGVSYIKDQLRMVFGDNASMKLSTEGGMFAAEITVPRILP